MDVFRPPSSRSAAEVEEEEEVDPAVEWRQAGEGHDVVEVALPGFRREHVRVQVDNYGVLRVSGSRRGESRWVRFRKDLLLPENCDADGVRARFEDEKLLITLPIVAADDDAHVKLKPTVLEPKQMLLPREPTQRPPPVTTKSALLKPMLRPPPRPLPPSLPQRDPPHPATVKMKQTFLQPNLPPPPPPRQPSRLPPLAVAGKSTFFGENPRPLPRYSNQAPPTAELKPFPAPSIGPVPKEVTPSPPLRPWTKRVAATATVAEPPRKAPALAEPDGYRPTTFLRPPPSRPPPPRQLPAEKNKHRKQGEVQEKVDGLPFMEEMRRKTEAGRKARDRATAPTTAVDDEKRQMEPPAATMELVVNMAAAATVLVGIALSVWRAVAS